MEIIKLFTGIEFCPKVNQVVYSLDTIYEPNIVILVQSILQILCSHGPLWAKCQNQKRGIIQILSEFYEKYIRWSTLCT